jgi:hypothetical protein
MEKNFPQEYQDKKITLESLKVGGFAWKREYILKFLQDPNTREFAVLGGDVLSYTNGKLAYTYDNWSAPERPRTEPFESFCQRTRDEALKYIRNYPEVDDVIFAPVVTSEVTAGWMS